MRKRWVSRTCVAVAAFLLVGLSTVSSPVRAQESGGLKIGDISSYNRWAAFTVPYRNGWQLALDEINASGGVLGKKVTAASRDDGATPTDAVRAAEELVTRDGATVLMGGYLSNVALAIADYAKQKKVVYVASIAATDSLTMDQGNRYTFHLRANVYMYANMLAEQARALGVKRWAIVAPNYEFGHSAAEAFKKVLKDKVPDVVFVAEQYPPLGKIDGGAISNALEEAKPDGIFSALFGADMAQFARDGIARGLFDSRYVLSIASGYPEYLAPMRDQVPIGWITHGYPWSEIDIPEHKKFVEAYRAKFGEPPGAFSMMGYIQLMMIRDAVTKAKSVAPDDIVSAMKGMHFESIVGPLQIREIDNKVSLGTWVGKLGIKNGAGAFVDWSFKDGANYMYPEAEVRARRKE